MAYAKVNTNLQPIDKHYKHTVQLQRLYFLPEHQGKGLGRGFLSYLVDRYQKSGFQSMWCTVWPKNKQALLFYSKIGFLRDGYQDFHYANRVERDYLFVLFF